MQKIVTESTATQKIFFGAIMALLAYSLVGFLILPVLTKYTLVKKIPLALNRPVAIEKIRINPYTLNVRIQGFNLRKKEGDAEFVAFEELSINLQAASLFKKAIIVKDLSLSQPRINLCRNLDRSYNFTDLLGNNKSKSEAGEAGLPLLFSINNIEIVGGEITLDDKPKSSVHQIETLAMAIPAISNLPYHIETYVQPSFSALINGTKMELGGMVKPFADSQETIIDLQMTGINIPSYLSYLPTESGIALSSALIDLDIKISFINYLNKSSRLAVTGEVMVREVEVVGAGQRSYLRLPRLTLEFAESNLLEKNIHLKKVIVQDLAMTAWRQENGEILPLSLLAPERPEKAGAVSAQEVGKQQSGLLLAVDLFEVAGGSGRFHDAATGAAQPVLLKLDDLNIKLTNFSTARDNRADLTIAMGLNGSGEIKGQGQVGADPLFAALDFNLANVVIKPCQAYFQQQLKIAITDGVLASKGRLSIQQQEERLALQFQGQAALDNLVVLDTLKGDDLLGWQSLQFKGISFATEPQALTIDDITLQGLAAKLIIREDGSANISSLAVAGGPEAQEKIAEEKEQEETAKKLRVAVNKVVIENGGVAFVDRNVRPSYAAILHDLTGNITGLSSATDSQASLDFSGKINKQAPLLISGNINPLQEEPFVDLQLKLADLNLSHTSPYTGTYLGYKTEKGKFNLDLQYLLQGRELDGKNNLFFDQFTLGKRVDSPDDLNLPISLALALLKNRQGEISLDIPVAGNLDDPKFSINGVVFKVLKNIIAKAATSPFSLLSSLIPAGEDLQTVPFGPGAATPSAEGQDKLDKLAHVLFERPGLKMEIRGLVDGGADRRALARQLLVKMVQGQKQQETKAVPGAPLSTEEYNRYLKKLFTLRQKAAGQVTPSSAQKTEVEMEEYIISGLQVPDDQLRLLAIDRANQARHYLVEKREIAPERLFVIEPQGLGEQIAEEMATAVRIGIK